MDKDKFNLISVHFNTKIGCLMESPNHDCSTLTVPMSHCWLFSHGWGENQPNICSFQHQDWVSYGVPNP
eukprot:scaffold119785_cov43-Cyclotella_meneghiniana.AAC.2